MSIGLTLRPQRLSLRLQRTSDQQSRNRVDQHLGVWLLR